MLNERSDVYSFGILLMEIITGRNPVDYSRPEGEVCAQFLLSIFLKMLVHVLSLVLCLLRYNTFSQVNLVDWLKSMVTNRNAEGVLDRSKSVCASVVQDCFFLCFLCHLAGTCEYKGLPFLGEKEGKSGKETLNVFSFNDIKKSNVSVCDALFLSSKTVTSKNTSSKRVEVFSSALDAQIDCQNSTRNQLKFAIYLHDWLIFIYLVVEAWPCFFPFIFGCIFCYLMFKLNFGMEVVVLVRNC